MRDKKLSLIAILFIIPFILLFSFNVLDRSKIEISEVNNITYYSGNESGDSYEIQQVKMFAIDLKVKGDYDEKIKSTPLTCKTAVNRLTKLIYIDGEEELGYKYIVYKNPAGELMKPTKKGYTFIEWTNTDGEVIDENSIIDSTEDYPVYAQWNIIVSQLEVDPNGGTWNESVGNQSFSMEYSAKKDIEDPTRVGYTFDKWELTGADSTLEEKVFTMGTEDALLKAIYNANEYTLTIDPNGGKYNNTSELTKMTIKYDSRTPIPNPTRTGYTFIGWTVSAGELNGNEFFMNHTGDVTLTANWQINSYKYIVYHSQQSIDGTAYNKVANDTEAGERNYGTVLYPNVKSYTGFTSPNRQTLTIQEDTDPPVKNILDYKYARNRYGLTINPNGGTWNSTSSNSSIQLYYQQTYNVANPTRTGYNFTSWTKTSNDSTLTDRVFKMGLANTTLTANWTPKTYTLTYDANGGSVSPRSKQIKYDQAYGTLPTPTKNGYRFEGWYTAASGGTRVTESTIHRQDKNVTIYAHWSNTPPTVNISVQYANGSGTAGSLVGGTETITVTVTAYDREDTYPSITWSCNGGNICPTGTITQVSNSNGRAVYRIIARKYGASTFYATARDKAGLTAQTGTALIVYGAGGALSDTVYYTNTTYDSGWFDVLESCYISNFSFTVKFASGHSNSSYSDPDVMVAYGRTESGNIVELYRWTGNMLSEYHRSDLIEFNKYNNPSNRIRQIGFYTYSPHSSCARDAVITYSIEYNFDLNLINSRYHSIYGSLASTIGSIR